MKNLIFFVSFLFFLQGCYQQESLKDEKRLLMMDPEVANHKEKLNQRVMLYNEIINKLKFQLEDLQRQDPKNKSYQEDLEELNQREDNLVLVFGEINKKNATILESESPLIDEMEEFPSIIGSLKNIEKLKFDQKEEYIEAAKSKNKGITQGNKEKIKTLEDLIENLKKQLETLQGKDQKNKSYQKDLDKLDILKGNFDSTTKSSSQIRTANKDFNRNIGRLKTIEELSFEEKQACIDAAKAANESKVKSKNKELTQEEKKIINTCKDLIENLKKQLETLQEKDLKNEKIQKDLKRLNRLKGNFDPTKKFSSQIKDAIRDFSRNIGYLKNIEALQFDQKQTCIVAVKAAKEIENKSRNKELKQEEEEKIKTLEALIEKLKKQLETLQGRDLENESCQKDLERLNELKGSFDPTNKSFSQLRDAIKNFNRNIGYLKNIEGLEFDEKQACIETANKIKSKKRKINAIDSDDGQ